MSELMSVMIILCPEDRVLQLSSKSEVFTLFSSTAQDIPRVLGQGDNGRVIKMSLWSYILSTLISRYFLLIEDDFRNSN